jgi:serine/threonine protein kinase
VTHIDSLHVLRLHGVEAQAGVMVLAFEAADGADLASALAGAHQRDECLGGHRALDIVIQAARALSAGARAGFIHGRLTPAHLLIGRDGTVKVDGIGLIHSAPTWVGDHGVEPTPYSAPEQSRGPGDIRSDLFSLGAIFYEMLTGQLPYGKGVHLSAHQRPPLPQTIDSGVGDHQQRMVMRLLERDPAARIQHPDELIAVLDPDYAPITAPRAEPAASAPTPPVPQATPSWIVRALVAGIALATVATLATIAVPRLHSGDSAAIALLKSALAILDQPKAIPPWAEHDLDELARVRGDQDPDVARWRAKLALWRSLQQALGDLDRPGAPLRPSAESADLLRDYVALVGADDPAVERWRAKIAAAPPSPSGR